MADKPTLIHELVLREAEIKRGEFYLRNGKQITPHRLIEHLAWRFSSSKKDIKALLYKEQLKGYGDV